MIACLAALALAACVAGTSAIPAAPSPAGAGTAASGAPARGTTPAVSIAGQSLPSGATSPPAVAFPTRITDDQGTVVAIAAMPRRIVSLAPSITETLFALGEGPRIVGVTDADDYPPAAKDLPHVATYAGVEIEKVVAARPDLVLAWRGITQERDIAKMRSLGLAVVVLYATTVQRVLDDMGLVARATGTAAQAVTLIGGLSARIQAVSAAASTGTRPRIFYELDATKAIYGLAPDDFTADLIRLAGGDPITSGTPGSYAMSLESLVAADPQVIILGDAAYGTTAAQVASRPGWGTMSAVRDGAIRPIDDVVVTRPGPRIAEGLAALAVAIHPGLVLPSPAPGVAP